MTAEPITLGNFLKLVGAAESGGDAKHLIQSGLVRVNDVVETRRGRKLAPGDRVEARGQTHVVDSGAGGGKP
jgi:ribosome-associated protein